MIEADLTGFDAHGIVRLGAYCNWLKSGRVNAKANIKVLQRSPATALVDGDDGIGHLVMTYATNLAIELARDVGRRLGRRAEFQSRRRRRHLSGDGGRAGHGRHLCRGVDDEPHGAVGRRRGADGNEPDRDRHSGRQGSAGGARHRHLGLVVRQRSGSISPAASRSQEGWVVHSKTGKPITDPKKVDEGVLLPIGGHKGSGLALMIGLLAGVLNGAAFGRDVVDPSGPATEPTNTGQFVRRARCVALHRAGGFRGRDGPASQRPCLVADACRASIRSGCRAPIAASAAPTAAPTACSCRRR